MIDFRYHLVSLIAVFLALAVGIVLGAGPLRDTIGDTLTGQVQDLRADRDQLRADLEGAEQNVAERSTYLDAAAPELLDGALEGRRVALVTLPDANADDVEALRERLEQAGAEVSGEVAVTEAWTDPETLSFRQTFAGQLLGYIDPAPAEDAGVGTIFGAALGQALVGDGDALSDNAGTLLDLLTSSDAPFITLTTEPTAPADATLLVGPRPSEEPVEDTPEDETEAAAEALEAHVRLADALASAGASATVGAAASDRDLVSAIRADDDASASVTTVDSVGEITAEISAPLALAVSISGATDSFGFQTGAEVPVPPRVELPADQPADAEQPAGDQPAEPTEQATEAAS